MDTKIYERLYVCLSLMMSDRGYDIIESLDGGEEPPSTTKTTKGKGKSKASKDDKTTGSMQSVIGVHRRNVYQARDNGKDLVYVFIMEGNRDSKDVNLETFSSVVTFMEDKVDDENGVPSHAILISPSNYSPPVYTNADKIKDRIRIELFFFHELLSNINRHVLQPKVMRQVVGEERDDLFKKLGIKDTRDAKVILPAFMEGGPLTKYYDWQPGTIILIKRSKNKTYYRVVL